jgi:hypothetical protein
MSLFLSPRVGRDATWDLVVTGGTSTYSPARPTVPNVLARQRERRCPRPGCLTMISPPSRREGEMARS